MRYDGTLIVTSHDRHFLNAVCTHIADIDYQTIITYTGGYDDMVVSINALNVALWRFDGTVFLVTHDQDLMEEVGTRVWRFGDGRIEDFKGTYHVRRVRRLPRLTAKWQGALARMADHGW